jgi:hypothetical protein
MGFVGGTRKTATHMRCSPMGEAEADINPRGRRGIKPHLSGVPVFLRDYTSTSLQVDSVRQPAERIVAHCTLRPLERFTNHSSAFAVFGFRSAEPGCGQRRFASGFRYIRVPFLIFCLRIANRRKGTVGMSKIPNGNSVAKSTAPALPLPSLPQSRQSEAHPNQRSFSFTRCPSAPAAPAAVKTSLPTHPIGGQKPAHLCTKSYRSHSSPAKTSLCMHKISAAAAFNRQRRNTPWNQRDQLSGIRFPRSGIRKTPLSLCTKSLPPLRSIASDESTPWNQRDQLSGIRFPKSGIRNPPSLCMHKISSSAAFNCQRRTHTMGPVGTTFRYPVSEIRYPQTPF